MPIKITKDGRTIRTGKDYTQFRIEMHAERLGSCWECGRDTFLDVPLDWDNSFHVDHTNGRGMGGGKRDDTKKACRGLCGFDHRRKHGQQ